MLIQLKDFLLLICRSIFWWRWQFAIVALQFQWSIKEKHVSVLQAHKYTDSRQCMAYKRKMWRARKEIDEEKKFQWRTREMGKNGARFFYFIFFFLEVPVVCVRVCAYRISFYFWQKFSIKSNNCDVISMPKSIHIKKLNFFI